LLPGFFSKVHKKYRTPHVSTWIAGFAVAIPAGTWDIDTFADLSNIGTLFAFIVVSAGVLILRKTQPDRKPSFRVPSGELPWRFMELSYNNLVDLDASRTETHGSPLRRESAPCNDPIGPTPRRTKNSMHGTSRLPWTPDEETNSGLERQAHHQHQAEHDRENREVETSLIIGLVIYYFFGRKHSRLQLESESSLRAG
jgi:hypothetical protein